MTARVKTGAQPPKETFTVSGFFGSEQAVHDALWDCLRLGVPRDLIDVALSPAAARRFYPRGSRGGRDRWFSTAGRGALLGLVLSALLSLGVVLIPGYNAPEWMSVVQLLGPDIAILLGGALGAVYGWLKPVRVKPQLLRARERDDAILLLVHLQPRDESRAVEHAFSRRGGEQVKTEADSAEAVGTE